MKWTPQPARTYKTEENAERSIVRLGLDSLRYMIVWTKEGRCYPVFIGKEALPVIHKGFTVVG